MFIGYRVSVWDDVKVLGMDNGDGCIAVRIHSMCKDTVQVYRIVYLKMVRMVNLMYFTTTKMSLNSSLEMVSTINNFFYRSIDRQIQT